MDADDYNCPGLPTDYVSHSHPLQPVSAVVYTLTKQRHFALRKAGDT